MVAVTPDGKMLASASADHSIRLWQTDTGKMIRRLRAAPWGVTSFAISSDGQTLAFAADDETIHLWNLISEHEERLAGTLGREGLSLAFAPDDRTLAIASGKGEIQIWELASKSERLVLSDAEGNLSTIAYSRDGKILASGGSKKLVRLWDPLTGLEFHQLRGHHGEASALSFSPDGQRLAVASGDRAVLVWTISSFLKGASPAHVVLAEGELAALWNGLQVGHAGTAVRSMARLIAGQHQSVAFLEQHLREMPALDVSKIHGLVRDLDDDAFTVRQAATEELEKLGELARPALNQVVRAKPSIEAARRTDQLLRRLETGVAPPNRLQMLRALEVLERIGTPAARQALESLASRTAQAVVGQEAAAVLKRAAKLQPGRP